MGPFDRCLKILQQLRKNAASVSIACPEPVSPEEAYRAIRALRVAMGQIPEEPHEEAILCVDIRDEDANRFIASGATGKRVH